LQQVQLGVSVVLYHTPLEIWEKCLQSLEKTTLPVFLYIVENSSRTSPGIKVWLERLQARDNFFCKYIRTPRNLGYGKAHNLTLKESLRHHYPYHLVLNPDIYFEEGVLEELYSFMEKHPEVGLVMPKVVNPEGELQYLCRLLPSPLNLIARRFLSFSPFKDFVKNLNQEYELRFANYDQIMEVPYLSGCFMFLRTKVLKKVGLFDERFFMYLEDVDLCRRLFRYSKNVFYPYVHVYHVGQRSSYNNWRLLIYHVISAIRYFNKWGWIYDRERKEINRSVIKKLKKSSFYPS